MTAATSPASRPARTVGLRRAWSRLRRRGDSIENRMALGLALFSIAVSVSVSYFPEQTPFTSLMLPVVLGSILLGPRTLPWFVIFDMSLLTYCVSQQDPITTRIIGAAAVQFLIALVVLVTSFRRTRLGVAGLRGETMFVDLRDRILDQGHLPGLPTGWAVESALHSAGGTAFAGDFIVAAKAPDARSVQIVVVDVSGKGEEAGTRALLLSGAFGGLLGAMPPDGFLPAANDYLLRQDWDEGFATAIHLWLDLTTGDFEVRTAGHPPAAHRLAGPGRWSVLRSDGPVLGLIEGAEFGVERGRLGAGDAVLLYTDGMVEEPRRDIDLGIDRLLGEAESLLRGSFAGAAERLAQQVGSKDDDRAVLVVHRT
ncbi:PP2C family protein-serine/threonine phosphatase [Nocardioides sp.]|uniref:PP2C family protein-serine/threonine phosphatase n=1 Tax=Nocardioides sp. TaxID=35761 RepID=UPI00271F84CA|nr:PP2C family protein-serine/threonine phosphatase [Nocardioides sp.]MDO9454992.1 PP2C family protein-serine/threonine phosphatase [Nocardioides sp.]